MHINAADYSKYNFRMYSTETTDKGTSNAQTKMHKNATDYMYFRSK
jgi:hypothetical protein